MLNLLFIPVFRADMAAPVFWTIRKIPSKNKAEVARYRASTWTEEDKENPQRAGRQIVVRQNPDNPADYKVEVDSRIDFQVGRNISPRE